MAKQQQIYGSELFQHKPTLRFLIWHYFYNKFINLERHKQSIYRQDAKFIDPEMILADINTKFLAVIKDDEVVEILRMQESAANKLIDSDKLLEFDPSKKIIKIGMKIDEKD